MPSSNVGFWSITGTVFLLNTGAGCSLVGSVSKLLVVGGGVKGGHVHGESDDLGFSVTKDPVHVHDLQATWMHLLGFDHEQLTYRFQGRDYRLTDVHGHVIKQLIA